MVHAVLIELEEARRVRQTEAGIELGQIAGGKGRIGRAVGEHAADKAWIVAGVHNRDGHPVPSHPFEIRVSIPYAF